MLSITVILCTYNRHESLATALESVAASQLADSTEWEVLVVDNNSKDQTRAVIEKFCEKFPRRFRYLFEPKPGKSHALSTGIREARGSVLAFVDDDVVVDRTWLQNLTAPFQSPTWVGVGGRILPERNFTPPAWLNVDAPYALAPLAVFDLGTKSRPLDEPPFGTNMAFRKEVFAKYGGFRTDLGPRPGNEIRNEDTEFGRRLLAAGEHLFYEPSAIVYHSVPQNRVRKEYFLDWWFDKARADIREFGIPPATRWSVKGIPLYVFRRLAVWTVRWMIALNSGARFGRKLKVYGLLGLASECYRQSATIRVNRKDNAKA